jgi:hypothetical protein
MSMEAKTGEGSDRSMVAAAIWMVVITLALFFLPLRARPTRTAIPPVRHCRHGQSP